jgi:hypothetical protein
MPCPSIEASFSAHSNHHTISRPNMAIRLRLNPNPTPDAPPHSHRNPPGSYPSSPAGMPHMFSGYRHAELPTLYLAYAHARLHAVHIRTVSCARSSRRSGSFSLHGVARSRLTERGRFPLARESERGALLVATCLIRALHSSRER